eukprot:scaffold20.g7783.t1
MESGQEQVAVKVIDACSLTSVGALEQLQEEISALSTLRHKHIIRLLGVHPMHHSICFVMEHMSGGTLKQYLLKQEGRVLPEAEARRIFVQILQAVDYCHRHRFVHRDLKPENVLLDGSGQVKVVDFGLAGLTTPLSGDLKDFCGTPEFAAPELLGSNYDGPTADLWSLGVILYELLQARGAGLAGAGFVPFRGPDLAGTLRAATRGECAPLPATVSPECRDLVARLLRPKPTERITMEEMMGHPWLAADKAELTAFAALSVDSSREEEAGPGAEAGCEQGSAQPNGDGGAGVHGSCSGSNLGATTLVTHDSLSLVLPGMDALAVVDEAHQAAGDGGAAQDCGAAGPLADQAISRTASCAGALSGSGSGKGVQRAASLRARPAGGAAPQ